MPHIAIVPPPAGDAETERARREEAILSVPCLDWYEARTHTAADGRTLPYRLFVPRRLEPGRRYPLVLLLHYAGRNGSDNRAQVEGDHAAGLFALPETQARHPCFVVAPQVPARLAWVYMAWTTPTNARPARPNRTLRMALEVVDALLSEFPVDARRLYVTGASMGGFGTWDAVSRRPAFFAGAVPICGGYDERAAGDFLHTPVWAFHGEKDAVIPAARSQRMVAAIRQAGGDARCRIYAGAGHEDAWRLATTDPELVEWLFGQRRGDEGVNG